MQKTDLCKTCKYYACPLVPPVMVKNAEVLVIGEAPGVEEAKQKIPFVGKSGLKLRAVMKEAGFDLSKVAITNTVKCRPPENEQPPISVRKLCAGQFLFKEISEIKPRLILCVGAVAESVFEHVSDTGDLIKEWGGYKIAFILHPAAVLYNPMNEPKFRRGIRKAYNYLYPQKYDRILKVVDTLEQLDEVRKFVEYKRILGADIETNNTLDPFSPNARIIRIAFGDDHAAYSISLDRDDPVFTKAAIDFIKGLLKDPTKTFIFQRSWFDVKFLKARGIDVAKFTDTRLMAYLLNENRGTYGLKELASEYVGEYEYTIDEKDRERFGLYNAEDSWFTYKVYQALKPQMTPGLTNVLEKILLPAIPVINEMMLTGICVDKAYAKKLAKEMTAEREATYEELLKKYPVFRGINLGSSKQMQMVVFDVLKERSVKKTGKKDKTTRKETESLDGEVMSTFAYEGREWAKLILHLRKIDKLLSTYVTKIPTMVYPDGRIRCEINPMGTVTGRFSSDSPNMQNIARDNKIYRMFVAGEGKMFFYFDFSQLELRVGASIAGERKMIDAFAKGADLHIRTACMITGKKPEEITKTERQLAKGCIDGDALIFTGRGIVPLREVIVGDMVYTGTSYKKVLAKRRTGVKQCTTIDVVAGYQVRATPDHEFLTQRGWHDAKLVKDNIRNGESWYKVVVSAATNPVCALYHFENKLPRKMTWTSNKIKLPEWCDCDVGFFFGFILAEGNFTKKGICVNMRKDPEFKWREFAVIAHRLFGEHFRQKDIMRTPWGMHRNFYVSGVDIVRWARQHGVTGTSKHKMVPNCILRSPAQVQGAFVRGLWLGDGSVMVSGKSWARRGKVSFIKITLHSEILIRQLQIMLLQNGILSRISATKVPEHDVYWCLTIYPRFNKKFIKFAGLHEFFDEVEYAQEKEGFDQFFDNYFMPVVENGKRTGTVEVYDLEIEDDHRFVANGFVVHNCSFGLLYGQQAEGLKKYLFEKFSIDIPIEEAERVRGIFFANYSDLLLWYDRVRRELLNTQQVVYPTGRVRRFPEINAIGNITGEIFRAGVNSPVQGAGNDVVVFSMVNLHRLVNKRKLPVKFVLTVHDSVMLEMDDQPGLVEELKELVNLVIKEIVPKEPLFRWIKCPLEVECKIGKSWGTLEKI